MKSLVTFLPLFQGFKRHQSHTTRRERPPECQETAEEFKKVDVLCHHLTAGDSRGHCGGRHPAVEEGRLAWLQTGRAPHLYITFFSDCVICV